MKFRYSRQRLLILVVCVASGIFHAVDSLPLYTAGSGRMCDNCHMNPYGYSKQKGWQNPVLKERKCNLSCMTCHTDPNGGGQRLAPARYYQFSTLPMFTQESRPYWDRKRDIKQLISMFEKEVKQPPKTVTAKKTEVKPSVQNATAAKQPPANVPDQFQKHLEPPFYTLDDPFQFSSPTNQKNQSTYAFKHGLYGDVNADPFLSLASNIRLAFVKTEATSAFFPMQLDFGASLHPVEHITLGSTIGVLGQAKDITKGENSSLREIVYVIRNAYLKLHELPYMAYARVGAFVPAFGQRIDDHTAFTRRMFEFDPTNKNDAVFGGEFGLAPNYPYLTASFFTNQVGNYAIHGWGSAVTAGWRDLAFGGGVSFLIKHRDDVYGGDLAAVSFDWYFNLGRIFIALPLVLSGEFAWGQKTANTNTRNYYANFLEINYQVFNGINLKVNQHFYDDDFKVKNDEIGRFGSGFDLHLIGSIKLMFEHRWKWVIAEDKKWRQGNLINPYDFDFASEWITQLNIYF